MAQNMGFFFLQILAVKTEYKEKIILSGQNVQKKSYWQENF